MASPQDSPLHVFVVAGEPSGDNMGARIMAAVGERSAGPVAFSGLGGPQMVAAGLDSLFAMDEIAIFGMLEVAPHLMRVFKRMDDVAAAAIASRPNVVLTIDSPAFSFAVAERIRKRAPEIPLVHLNAPKVWAYRPGRVKRVARAYDHLLCLLPFEPGHFERAGLASTFIGHPAVEFGADRGDAKRFRQRHGLSAEDPVLCVLPGSRHGEIKRLGALFGSVAARLKAENPALQIVVPTVAGVADAMRSMIETWDVGAILVEDSAGKFDAFAASGCALAASGTVTVELAMAGVPTVVAYRLSPVTAAIVRGLIRVDTATITNLVLERKAVPEFLQEACTADNLYQAVRGLLEDPAARSAMRDACDEASTRLGRGGAPPSGRAADILLQLAEDSQRVGKRPEAQRTAG